VNVFLNSSVLLAACGSAAGASRAVIDAASAQGWSLLTSSYVHVLAEVEANVSAPQVERRWISAHGRARDGAAPGSSPGHWRNLL